jgi:uncharacterized glyoxalase superfamily protein PhnB
MSAPASAPLAERHQIHGLQPVLPVPDVAAAVDWYERLLGFERDFVLDEPPAPPYYGRVKLGTERGWGDAVFIHLQRDTGPITPCGETRLHVGHDIDGLHAHVLAAGGEVVEPPADQPWGLREFTLRAPGGHMLVLGAEVQAAPMAAAVVAPKAAPGPAPGAQES